MRPTRPICPVLGSSGDSPGRSRQPGQGSIVRAGTQVLNDKGRCHSQVVFAETAAPPVGSSARTVAEGNGKCDARSPAVQRRVAPKSPLDRRSDRGWTSGNAPGAISWGGGAQPVPVPMAASDRTIPPLICSFRSKEISNFRPIHKWNSTRNSNYEIAARFSILTNANELHVQRARLHGI